MAKKRKSRKKTSGNNSMLMLIGIVAVLAILSVVAAYFILNNNEQIETIETVTEIVKTDSNSQETVKPVETKTPIEGTWVSNYDGAMLTISGLTFTIELPSVDAGGNVKGNIAVEKTIVIFTNINGIKNCIGNEGHYNYSFENDELILTKIKDNCESRSERMTESWFRL